VERNCTTEAGQQDFVATKVAEQVDLHTLHRLRERLFSQRTGIINQIRAFLLQRGRAVHPYTHASLTD
jgi:transposase